MKKNTLVKIKKQNKKTHLFTHCNKIAIYESICTYSSNVKLVKQIDCISFRSSWFQLNLSGIEYSSYLILL